MQMKVEKHKFLISLLLNDIYCTAQNTMVVCTFRSHSLNLNYYTVECKETMKIKIFILQFKSFYSKTVHVATTQ